MRKPDPEIYALVLERLALPAEACAFVDDLEHNVDAARALGFAAVHHADTPDTIAALDALLAA
jgi:putative hydrolase of the HAD superfamily